MTQAEAQHRDHAIVEQVFADLTSGPRGSSANRAFPANAAWLALAAICHDLTRAAGWAAVEQFKHLTAGPPTRWVSGVYNVEPMTGGRCAS
jgi:hypothetical protein